MVSSLTVRSGGFCNRVSSIQALISEATGKGAQDPEFAVQQEVEVVESE